MIVDMNGFSNVGIVYGDQKPELFSQEERDALPWEVNFFSEHEVCEDPGCILKDYLAVFFPINLESSGLRRCIANRFPDAEIIGYHASGGDSRGSFENLPADLEVIQFPVSLSLIRFILENLSSAKKCRRELVRARLHLDSVCDLFHSFADAMESSFNIPDFKLGRSLLINKILARIQAEECLLYVWDKTEASMTRAYSTGNIQNIDLFEQDINHGVIGGVFDSGIPCVNNDLSFEIKTPFNGEPSHIRSLLCYPLKRGSDKIGVVTLLNKLSGPFTQEDCSFLELTLDPLAVSIRATGQFEELERLTITDDLTKLYNYRYLKKYLEIDVKRCLRHRKKVSLLFIDIDGFKRVNDTFGHLVGSRVLAEMGQVFKTMVRDTDVVGRYGGDEFVIILPDTPLAGALIIAERIRKKVEEWEFIVHNNSFRLTVSLGVANCPQHTATAENLIQKADAAMYQAKELSKNSIKTAV